jgi:hypothetical protein
VRPMTSSVPGQAQISRSLHPIEYAALIAKNDAISIYNLRKMFSEHSHYLCA